MKYIDMNRWNRRGHFEFFYGMDYPVFNICFNMDITGFMRTIASGNIQFFYAMIYFSTAAANCVPEFRHRIRKGQVVEHDTVHPAFTDMDRDDDLFKLVVADMKDNVADFINAAAVKSENQKGYFVAEEIAGRDDLLYLTSTPWISFTHLSHTIRLDRDDSVPRISWGRYFTESGKILLPFSVQVNHAVADGIHIGRYKSCLEHMLNDFRVM